MRMQLVAIFACVSFALCCVCCVWPCMAFGSELTSEPVAESATSGPAASDAVATADEAAGPVKLGAAPLAASAVTLDTVNNNVLNYSSLPMFTHTQGGHNVPVSLKLWLTSGYYTRYDDNGNPFQQKTILGDVQDTRGTAIAIKSLLESPTVGLSELRYDTTETLALLSNRMPEVQADLRDIKSAVTSGSGSGSVSIADEQWQVLNSTVQFQNFALLVLTLLSSASIGCSLWGAFSKGWRK